MKTILIETPVCSTNVVPESTEKQIA